MELVRHGMKGGETTGTIGPGGNRGVCDEKARKYCDETPIVEPGDGNEDANLPTAGGGKKMTASKKTELQAAVYNIPEIAVLLDINVIKAYELAKRKDFPTVRIGRRIVVPKQAFCDWLDDQVQQKKR